MWGPWSASIGWREVKPRRREGGARGVWRGGKLLAAQRSSRVSLETTVDARVGETCCARAGARAADGGKNDACGLRARCQMSRSGPFVRRNGRHVRATRVHASTTITGNTVVNPDPVRSRKKKARTRRGRAFEI